MEDALYEIASMRLFARLSTDSALPDRTTIMNFRHLLEQHPGPSIVQDHQSLAGRSRRHDDPKALWWMPPSLSTSSTENKEQQRDPEMHQTKKGNQWHFGMKAHVVSMPNLNSLHHRGPSMTSISWVICFMDNLSQCRLQGWPRWMWTG
ncbi:Putative transposase (identified by ISEscan HMM) [Klebsiella pneumoniae]|nr:Putative transposase (identified by ISEscan HMM) [Klebsiella pneumoniae]